MKKFSYLFLILPAFTLWFSSCNKDDDDLAQLERPSITVPTGSTVQVGESTTLAFNVNAPGRIASLSVQASAGTATIANENELVNQTTGTVNVTFVAPENAGNPTVTLTVTDAQSPAKNESEVATVIVTAEPVVTIPEIDVYASPEGVGTSTWTADNIYVLRGFVYVNEGQTLTIEPGTVIKGQPGQGAGASALIVARGGRLVAQGTAENPIIFTALDDDIEDPDDIAINERGLWGGLILLGRAPINHANSETIIEGIPETEARGIYGGNDPDDDSGILSYISLRHGGTNIGSGNEINGLTLGGVGRGTQISFIEVYGNDDDGFEWFGGTVNTSYLASIYNQDDAFDWDFGYRGQNQFWFAYQEPDFAGNDRGMELDGAHSGNLATPNFSQPTIYNITLIGPGTQIGTTPGGANAIFMTEGNGGFIRNSIFANFRSGINLTDVGAPGMNTMDRLANEELAFQNNIFWNIGAYTNLDEVAEGYAPLATHLTANGNAYVNPGLFNIAAGSLNPMPATDGPAYQDLYEIPVAAVDGFDYEDVNYKGAFGDTNWLIGWSAADAYGLFE